jgi:hypothetical protein
MQSSETIRPVETVMIDRFVVKTRSLPSLKC